MVKGQKVSHEKDAIVEVMRKAIQAARAAQQVAYEDVRTSSTVCTDYLDSALKALENAADWYSELRQEEKADERRSIPKPKIKAKPEPEFCHICENEIEPDDLAVCGGCDKATCPNCMGDEEVCKECEAEPE